MTGFSMLSKMSDIILYWSKHGPFLSQLPNLIIWDPSHLPASAQLLFERSGEVALVGRLQREGDVNSTQLSWEDFSEICQFAECLVDFLQRVNIKSCWTQVFSLLIRGARAWISCSVICPLAWSKGLIHILLEYSGLSLCSGGSSSFEVLARPHSCLPPWLKQPTSCLNKSPAPRSLHGTFIMLPNTTTLSVLDVRSIGKNIHILGIFWESTEVPILTTTYHYPNFTSFVTDVFLMRWGHVYTYWSEQPYAGHFCPQQWLFFLPSCLFSRRITFTFIGQRPWCLRHTLWL